MEGKKVVCFEVEPWEQEFLKDKLQHKVELEFFNHRLTYDNMHEAAQANYVVSFIYSDLSHQVLTHLRHLKGIATMSVGVDHIDLEEAENRRIVVSNVPAYGPNTVAEHTMALLLAMSRKIVESVERTRDGVYEYTGLSGWDLSGKTLAVVGTGKIGAHVAQIAHGLDMKLIGFDPHPNTELTERFGLEYMPLNDVLGKADVITVHVPLTPENKHMLSTEQFKLMKKGVVILNTARGGLIDATALLAALDDSTVAQAGIDVLEDEGLLKEEKQFFSSYFKLKDYQMAMADHALMRHPKVLLTPHNAFNSKESMRNILNTTVENVEGMVSGDPVNTVEK
ncbi:MAG: NAD(P)-dependent oxidoreductase [bacterium]|nr:NAD(P)-dependent oxidoreductase [bacterium]